MAEFLVAIKTIFKHEGRFVDDPNDPGGATDYGISLRFLQSLGDLDHDGWPDGDINKDGECNSEDIKALSIDDAERLYKIHFWDKVGYERIHDQSIATKLFDLCVNVGIVGANKIAQRSVRSATGITLEDDGMMGFRTIAALNMCTPQLLLVAIKSEAAGYYRSLPKILKDQFLKGWLNRAYSNPY
jgi:lysozyme family protein